MYAATSSELLHVSDDNIMHDLSVLYPHPSYRCQHSLELFKHL